MEQDVDGAPAVDEDLLEANIVDAGVQDEGEATWFGDASRLVRLAKGDLLMRLGVVLRVSNLVVLLGDVHDCPSEQFSLMAGIKRDFAIENHGDSACRRVVYMAGI